MFLETIKVENGCRHNLEYHQQRMECTMKAFGIKGHYDLGALLAPPEEGLIRCRVLYDHDMISISYLAYVPRHFRTLQAVVSETLEYDYKYANRTSLEQIHAERGDADDVVIVKNGLLTDTPIANIALHDGTKWVTPKQPLLHGTTRRRLIDEGRLTEADIPVSELSRYGRCAIMNAMIGFIEVENGILPPK